MTFPLIYLPRRVIYVDDKSHFLEALRRSIPRSHSRQFFSSPQRALDSLTEEVIHSRELEALLSTADDAMGGDEREGMATKFIKGHFGSWSRFHLTSVIVVDYAMPGMDGLELIRKLGSWPGRRLLLTGEADVNVAVAAFNEGLIQRFIPKDTRDLNQVLRRACEEMHETVCEQIGHYLRPSLLQHQKDLLGDKRVVDALKRRIEELDWDEYIVIGAPFGILGMSNKGPLQWLQLETEEGLPGLASMAEAEGFAPPDIDHIRHGAVLTNIELHAELRLPGKARLEQADTLCEGPALFAALFDLPSAVLSAGTYGVDDIMLPYDEVSAVLRDLAKSDERRKQTQSQAIGEVDEPPSDGRPVPGISDVTSPVFVLQSLHALVSRSPAHRKAFETALSRSSLSKETQSMVIAHLAIDKAQRS